MILREHLIRSTDLGVHETLDTVKIVDSPDLKLRYGENWRSGATRDLARVCVMRSRAVQQEGHPS